MRKSVYLVALVPAAAVGCVPPPSTRYQPCETTRTGDELNPAGQRVFPDITAGRRGVPETSATSDRVAPLP